MIQFSFHSFTGIKYNLGSYAFFTLRKFVARFKLFSVLFLPYIGDIWNPVVSYRLQSKNITWGALRLFFWENFCPYKGTPQESNLASGPCSQTGQISLHTQNLCTKNHSPRNWSKLKATFFQMSTEVIMEGFWASIDRRLACLFFDSKLTAKWWYLRSSFWREYFSPRQTSTPARHFGSKHQQEEKKNNQTKVRQREMQLTCLWTLQETFSDTWICTNMIQSKFYLMCNVLKSN